MIFGACFKGKSVWSTRFCSRDSLGQIMSIGVDGAFVTGAGWLAMVTFLDVCLAEDVLLMDIDRPSTVPLGRLFYSTIESHALRNFLLMKYVPRPSKSVTTDMTHGFYDALKRIFR